MKQLHVHFRTDVTLSAGQRSQHNECQSWQLLRGIEYDGDDQCSCQKYLPACRSYCGKLWELAVPVTVERKTLIEEVTSSRPHCWTSMKSHKKWWDRLLRAYLSLVPYQEMKDIESAKRNSLLDGTHYIELHRIYNTFWALLQ